MVASCSGDNVASTEIIKFYRNSVKSKDGNSNFSFINNTNSRSLLCDCNPIVDCFALDGDLFCNRKNGNFFIKNAILIGPTVCMTL